MRTMFGVWRRFGLIVLAGLMGIIYLRVGLEAGAGQPLMPVDDAYIHFQYAKQAALGQPFVYNPADGATSGATSLIYPFILSIGWGIGFRELALGYWAVAVGCIALAACGIFTRRLVRDGGGESWLAEFMGVAIVTSGTVVWHAASGMETLLACALTLALLDGFMRLSHRQTLVAAALLTITRPEGGVLAAIACVIAVARLWRLGGFTPKLLVYGFPIVLMGLQPFLNWALTGSASATGGQAKSLLSLIPPDMAYIIGRVSDNFLRMWAEFITGYSAGGIWYAPPLMGGLAIVGGLLMIRRKPATLVLLAGWMLALTGAVSTLDTAFWHFKRYQMPLFVLLFPLTGWLLSRLPRRWAMTCGLIVVGGAIGFGWPFLGYYQQNTASVAAQPLQMAMWFRENAPDARVAVHDVGMVRYYGEVYTLDMVGLTTAGAADAWRNGVGATAEWLMKQRADYYAAYDDARGLTYLVDVLTAESGGIVAEFSHQFDPATNVALGGQRQVIIPLDGVSLADPMPQNGLLAPVLAERYRLIDTLDVADLVSESHHDYGWTNAGLSAGFPSEVYRLMTLGCDTRCGETWDGGRRITGGEHFSLTGDSAKNHLLVTRLHPVSETTLELWVNDTLISQSLVPMQPGHWFEVWTPIPAEIMREGEAELAISVRVTGGVYMPYYHWLYAEDAPSSAEVAQDVAVVFESAGVALAPPTVLQTDDRLQVGLTWMVSGTPQRVDGVAFAHLYADLDQPPVAQMDVRTGRGAYVIANWREPITGFTDEFVLDLATLPAGRYVLAVGLYAPVTFERFIPTLLSAAYQERDRRVIIGDVVIK